MLHSALSPLDQDICILVAGDKIKETTIPPFSSLRVEETTFPSSHGVLLALSSGQRTVAVIDRTADIASAAAYVVNARYSYAGESPYAPDLVLVNEFVINRFLEAAVQSSISYSSDNSRSLQAIQQCQDSAKNSKLVALTKSISTSEQAHVVISGQRSAIMHVTRYLTNGL